MEWRQRRIGQAPLICQWAPTRGRWSRGLRLGYGPWSTNSTFTIQAAVPNTITLLSPAGIVAVNGAQRYTWMVDPAATRYELYIEKDGSLFLDQWFTLADSVVDSATGNFAVDLSGIGSGTYLWWVRGWSPAGSGPWSDRMSVVLYRAP